MPSKLCLELDFSTLPALPTTLRFVAPPVKAQKPKMSLTQTYRVAALARNKLSKEALRGDHDLRLLVGHANLLDSLMLDLANAEREQEAWYNTTIRKAVTPGNKHIQWMDTVAEAEEAIDEDDDEYETMSEGDSDDEDLLLDPENFPSVNIASRQRRSVSPPPPQIVRGLDLDELEDDFVVDDEADEEHALVRVASNYSSSSSSSASSHADVPESDSLPALDHELDSDDDSPLPSPAKETFQYFPVSKKARTSQMLAATDLVREHLMIQPEVVAL